MNTQRPSESIARIAFALISFGASSSQGNLTICNMSLAKQKVGGLTIVLIAAIASVIYAHSAHAQAGSTGWTPFTSEELQPVECNPGTAVTGVACRGKYCDDVAIFCREVRWSLPMGASYWTQWISEETTFATCGIDEVMSGLACRGKYCDDLSIRCTQVTRKASVGCHWSGPQSEEDGFVAFGNGDVARAARCSGKYCDLMEFYVCKPE